MRLEITRHEFKHHIPDDFRWWMFMLHMFEESFTDSRFKKLWLEDRYHPHGVDIWMAEADGKPCGILVHEKDNRELPMVYTRLIGSKWTKPVAYGGHFNDFGRIGFFTQPKFRGQGIARKLFEKFEATQEKEHNGVRFPVIAGLDRAFKLISANSQWFYPLPTALPSFLRKTVLANLSKDLDWMTRCDPEMTDKGPFHMTRWRKGRARPGLDISHNISN